MFEKEIKHFNRNKSYYFKKYKNKFLVIKAEDFLGAYDSEQEAYKAGIDAYGLKHPFLIKKVEDKEPHTNIPALYVGLKNAGI